MAKLINGSRIAQLFIVLIAGSGFYLSCGPSMDQQKNCPDFAKEYSKYPPPKFSISQDTFGHLDTLQIKVSDAGQKGMENNLGCEIRADQNWNRVGFYPIKPDSIVLHLQFDTLVFQSIQNRTISMIEYYSGEKEQPSTKSQIILSFISFGKGKYGLDTLAPFWYLIQSKNGKTDTVARAPYPLVFGADCGS